MSMGKEHIMATAQVPRTGLVLCCSLHDGDVGGSVRPVPLQLQR